MSERLVLAVTAVLLAVVVALLVPFLGKDRAFLSSVPQPPPLFSTAVIAVPPGESACSRDVTIMPDSHAAQFRIGTRGRPPVAVGVTLTAPGGYRSTDRIPATWKDNDLLTAEIDPPARPVHGTFCLRNEGRRTVDVYASNDRTRTLAYTDVDGTRADANTQITFVDTEPASLAERTGELERELTVFRPGILGPWLLWPLAVLVVVGLPLGLGFVMWRATRDGA